jgi:hypothetical protein
LLISKFIFLAIFKRKAAIAPMRQQFSGSFLETIKLRFVDKFQKSKVRSKEGRRGKAEGTGDESEEVSFRRGLYPHAHESHAHQSFTEDESEEGILTLAPVIVAKRLLPFAFCLLPSAFCLLPFAFCLSCEITHPTAV